MGAGGRTLPDAHPRTIDKQTRTLNFIPSSCERCAANTNLPGQETEARSLNTIVEYYC
jgi:hypothetical protein